MLRKILLSLVGFLIVTVLLFGAAFALAQTQMAKDRISGLVESSLTSENQTAEVAGLDGLLPFDVRLGRFRLADDAGTWLEVDDARVKVDPGRLLAGEIVVEQAGAARVAVHRTPNLPESPPPPPSDEPFSLPGAPELPESLPRVTAERIFVDRIELGEALIGQDAVFNLEGRATTGPGGRQAEARLDLRRIDEATATLGLAAGLDLANQRVALDLEASETGGLMATLTGQEAAGDLSLRLNGQGPLADWRAELALAIENLVTADADLALAYAENPSVDLRLEVVPVAGALPPDIQEVLGERLELALAGGQRAPGHFALDTLSLESGIVTASGNLEARLEDDRLEGRIRLAASDLSRASGLAGQPLGGRAEVTLDALGTFSEPRFRLALDAGEIAAADLGVGSVDLAFDADLLGPLDQAFAGLSVVGGGSVGGLTQAGEPLRPEDSIRLDLSAVVPMEGEARLERLAITGDHVAVNGTATVMMPELAGTARLTGSIPSVEALLAALGPAAPADLAASGAVELVADIDLAAELERIGVDLALRGEGLGGLPQGLDALVGGDPRITTTVVVRPAESVDVQDLQIATAAIGLTGGLSLGLGETRAVAGRIDLSPLALASLEGLVGQPIAGELRSSVVLSGTLEELGVVADLTVDQLEIAERSFDRVVLDATAGQTAAGYGGNVVLGVEQVGDTLSLRSDFALEDSLLRLSGLSLRGPATDLSGQAEVALDELLATGGLAGRIGDLAALEAWTGQPLRGSVDVDASFDGSNGRQDAQLSLAVDDLVGDFGALRRASVEATVEDAMDRLGVDATITAGGFTRPEGGLLLEDATVRLTGDRSLFNLDLAANGEMDGPFNIVAQARADVLGETRTAVIDSLDGVFQGQSIRLMSPATARLEGGVLDIDQLDLRIGDASIQGNLLLDQPADRARAGLVIESLPMRMLAEFGAPPLLGELTGEIDLTGRLSAPLIDGRIRIAGLELDDGQQVFGRAAEVGVALALTGDGFVTEARVEGIGDNPIVAELRLPVRLSLAPFALDLPETLPLDGRVSAQSRLAPLVSLAALDGQTIQGDLDLDLTLGGTIDQPRLDGQVAIDNGRVADAISGVILTDLTILLRGTGDRLEIETFTARDPSGGRLELAGGMAIDFAEALPYRFDLRTNELRVLDSDLGRATVSAEIAMEGSGRGGEISGRITVPRADLSIPSGGGIDPVTLDVQVRGEPEPPPEPAAGPSGPDYRMALDLVVDMPARIFVRGRGLDTEWGGRLVITGTTREPVVTGAIDYRRGFLDFLDRRFQIREGTVTFTGSSPPVPDINLVAAAVAPSMTGIVRLRGPATDPEFELASEPELPQDEVLSQLLFDRDTSRLTPLQGVRLANAVSRLEGGGFDTMGALRDITGLDVVDFGNADFGDEESETTATAGRYVAENVFIGIDQGLSSGSTRARVEIELTPRITVRSDVDDRSQTGVGIEWRMDY